MINSSHHTTTNIALACLTVVKAQSRVTDWEVAEELSAFIDNSIFVTLASVSPQTVTVEYQRKTVFQASVDNLNHVDVLLYLSDDSEDWVEPLIDEAHGFERLNFFAWMD